MPKVLNVLLCISLATVALGQETAKDAPADDVDLIVLSNGHRLEGILAEPDAVPGDAAPGNSRILIRTRYGTIEVAKDRIKGIQAGLASRMRALRDDDPAGLVAFARWAVGRNHEIEALDALIRAVAYWESHPQVPVDLPALALYANLLDRLRDPLAAVPAYRLYQARGGQEPKTLERLAVLERTAGSRVPVTAAVSRAPVAPGVAAPTPGVPGGGSGIEMRGWKADGEQWSNPTTPHPVVLEGVDLAPGVTQALQVDFAGGDKDKAVISRAVNTNLENKPVIVMRLRNKSRVDLQVAIGLKTGEWVYHESKAQKIRANSEWTEFRFDLRDPTFKTEASGWTPSETVKDLGSVKDLQVLIYNARINGTILINGLRPIGTQEF